MISDPGSRALDVVQYIDSCIEKDGLQVGDRIGTREELRIGSGAARATVNEALKILRERGRVTVRPGPHGGIFLAEVDHGVQVGRFLLSMGKDTKNIADALAVRDHLEPMVFAEALAHRTEQDVSDLRRLIEQLRQVAEDDRQVVRGIFELHLRIGEITPNVILSSTYRGLASFIRDNVTESPHPAADSDPGFVAGRIEVHADLVEVIATQDASRLSWIIARHHEGEEHGSTGTDTR